MFDIGSDNPRTFPTRAPTASLALMFTSFNLRLDKDPPVTYPNKPTLIAPGASIFRLDISLLAPLNLPLNGFSFVPIGIHSRLSKSISASKFIVLPLKLVPLLTSSARPANSAAVLIVNDDSEGSNQEVSAKSDQSFATITLQVAALVLSAAEVTVIVAIP